MEVKEMIECFELRVNGRLVDQACGCTLQDACNAYSIAVGVLATAHATGATVELKRTVSGEVYAAATIEPCGMWDTTVMRVHYEAGNYTIVSQ